MKSQSSSASASPRLWEAHGRCMGACVFAAAGEPPSYCRLPCDAQHRAALFQHCVCQRRTELLRCAQRSGPVRITHHLDPDLTSLTHCSRYRADHAQPLQRYRNLYRYMSNTLCLSGWRGLHGKRRSTRRRRGAHLQAVRVHVHLQRSGSLHAPNPEISLLQPAYRLRVEYICPGQLECSTRTRRRRPCTAAQ